MSNWEALRPMKFLWAQLIRPSTPDSSTGTFDFSSEVVTLTRCRARLRARPSERVSAMAEG